MRHEDPGPHPTPTPHYILLNVWCACSNRFICVCVRRTQALACSHTMTTSHADTQADTNTQAFIFQPAITTSNRNSSVPSLCFADTLNSAKASHIHRVAGHEFSIAHYTGKLTYDARDLADKNRDFMPPEMVSVLCRDARARALNFEHNMRTLCAILLFLQKVFEEIAFFFWCVLSNHKQFNLIRV